MLQIRWLQYFATKHVKLLFMNLFCPRLYFADIKIAKNNSCFLPQSTYTIFTAKGHLHLFLVKYFPESYIFLSVFSRPSLFSSGVLNIDIVDFIKYFLSANTDTIYTGMLPVEQAQLLFLNTNVK